MSNIYIQQPPTNGKVLLKTSVGDIDIELWSKEAPKACRNFIQLCMESYYDGTIFHRVISGFIVQGGDPTGTGHGGESIYGHPFKDEVHSRLHFVRRGLVAMANGGPNDNGSQFFFTMGATPELMNKHTIFGKVSGNTIYNMLKLQECETDSEDRPIHPNKILKTQILANPFDDIIPRAIKKKKEEGEKKPKSKSKATKNFKLLSFGEEAEEDEEQVMKVTEGWKGKSKSSHDLTNDPRLSAVPALEMQEVSPVKAKEEKRPAESSEEEPEEIKEKEERRENIRKKLKKEPPEPAKKEKKPEKPEKTEDVELKPSTKSEELKQEAKQLKKEIRESKRREEQRKAGEDDSNQPAKEEVPPSSNDPLADFKRERQKYKNLRKQQGGKGQSREEITLSLLDKFKTKLNSAKMLAGDYSDEEEEKPVEEEDVTDLSWMHHKLHFDDKHHKVLDANVTDVERYEIFDPRNPLTKRRRDESKKSMKEKR